MPISSFFFPVLNSFPSACPGCCFYGVYCQPGDLCPFGGCFPGSLSTSQCPLPAGWRSGTVGSAAAGSLAPRGCHPRPCQCARGRFRCRPCHDCCAGMSRRATRQRALAGRCVSASEKLLWYRLLWERRNALPVLLRRLSERASCLFALSQSQLWTGLTHSEAAGVDRSVPVQEKGAPQPGRLCSSPLSLHKHALGYREHKKLRLPVYLCSFRSPPLLFCLR